MPARTGSHARPACLKEARSFRELFGMPGRAPSRSATGGTRSRGAAAAASAPPAPSRRPEAPGPVLVPPHVIESWDGEALPEPAPGASAPLPAGAAPAAMPAAPHLPDRGAGESSVRAAERTSRPARVVEAGTFRVSRAQLAADVDEIREGRSPAGRNHDEAGLIGRFLEHLASAERRTEHQN